MKKKRKSGGQFKPNLGGQFAPKLGGQFDRFFHSIRKTIFYFLKKSKLANKNGFATVSAKLKVSSF